MKYKTQALSVIFSIFFLNYLICQDGENVSTGDSISKYIYNQPHKAIDYCYDYIKLNEKINNIDGIILGYSALATAFGVVNEPDSTLHYYYKSLSLVKDPVNLIVRKYYIAKVYDKNSNYNEALRLYNQILDLAKREKEQDIVDAVNFAIALIKSKIDLYNEGFPKESLLYLENLYNTELKESRLKSLRYTRKKLVEVYIKDKQLEKAKQLIEEGLLQAKKENNKEFLFHQHHLKSKVNKLEKNYNISISEAEKSIKYAKDIKNQLYINQANFNLAEIAYELKEYKKALKYLKRILYNKNNKTSLQLSRDYKLKADIYNELDNIRLSNKFYSKHFKQKDKANKEYLDALKSIYTINTKEQVLEVQDSYETELQEEIIEKEQHQKTKWIWIGISAILLMLIISIILFFKNRSRMNQKRFDELMLKIKAYEERKKEENQYKAHENKEEESEVIIVAPKTLENNKEEVIEEVVIEPNEDKVITNVIDDKKVEEILIKLQNLEDKMYFLKQDCTLHNMAKRLKTNTSYLSKIINTHLGKSFSSYINELRINHAILEIKNNKQLRSYSVKGIAHEMGYKSVDAFTRYFKAATGITPAVYVKKIQEI
ncbi:helix-turn-helix domain-containing protein [Pontimicrobium sp. MEBiC06410]